MRNFRSSLIISLVVIVVSALAIWPPGENLRLGKDLAGGVSLTYPIELRDDDPPEVVDQMIQVLMERVNPQGLFEISMVRQGRDRLEITMPLPSDRVQELRDAFEAEIEAFRGLTFDRRAFERAMRLEGAERREALAALAETPAQEEMIGPVASALESASEARSAYESAAAELESLRARAEAAGDAGADEEADGALAQEIADLEEEVDRLVDDVVEAEIAVEEAEERALRLRVPPEAVREALSLSPEESRVRDEEADESVVLPSERERAMDRLRSRLSELPGGEERLDAVLSAYETYSEERSGLDDPDELQRLLQGAGVLELRIAVQPGARADEQVLREQFRSRGPGGVTSDDVVWVRLNQLEDWVDSLQDLEELQADPGAYLSGRYRLVAEEFEGEIYAMLHDVPGMRLTSAEGEWSLSAAFRATDSFGRPAVGFQMDPRGAARLGELTEANVGEPMAVILDGRLYTAPNIQDRLSTQAQITGQFSERELSYLIRTLNAGSLQARLGDEPLSVNKVAPELGADNLDKGLRAAWISLILVGAFMVFYYFSSGVVAMIALTVNAVIILGAMSLNRAAFTLPGIAGIVLTFGMAVDANVLIYERIREELMAGNDVRSAVRVAYQRVLSTIVDANVTNLIVCFVLAYTATQEVKGFAITLGIGVVATMFSALLVTRLIFTVLVDKVKVKKLRQLPIVAPAIHRAFEPRIDWIRLRPVFLVVSTALVGAGVFFIVVQNEEMLDTEFRGGVRVDLPLITPEQGASATFAGEPFGGTLTRATVEGRVRETALAAEAVLEDGEATAEEARASAEAGVLPRWVFDGPDDEVLERLEKIAELRNAGVTAIDPAADGVTSDLFGIKTTVTDQQLVRDVVVDRFGGVIDSQPALAFVGSGESDLEGAPVYPIVEPELGANLPGRGEIDADVSRFQGGVAILLEELTPALPEDSLRRRVDFVRDSGAYIGQTAGRAFELIVLETDDSGGVTSAAIVASDPGVNAVFDEQEWEAQLARPEWRMAREALANATTLAGVQSFSPEIAATFRARAIVAVLLSFMLITIYIWVRFGSLRYSLAALSCLVHDVITAIGLIALAEILYEVPFIAALGVQPYQIDLGLVAAILTIIGYSLNDTIIILDRIRENRGKLAYASREVVNLSINQTVSRTIITSGTTLLALVTMFIIGGEGIGSFTYALICGVIIGTYSSIAVAAPLVYTRKIPDASERFRDEASFGERAERRSIEPEGQPA